jgi:hypothetical protein
VGAKFAFVLDHLGHFVAWDCKWAHALDNEFGPLIAVLDDVTVVLTDGDWHAKIDNPT